MNAADVASAALRKNMQEGLRAMERPSEPVERREMEQKGQHNLPVVAFDV
jgi:hypothetical protein